MQTLEPIFNAQHVAILGASLDTTKPGGHTIRALKEAGFLGNVFPVNPKYSEIAGYRCYASLTELPAPCDLAVIALPATAVPDAIEACAERGVRYAVVLAGGFREAGVAGMAMESRMLVNARRHGVRIVGPNCTGIVNVHTGLYAAFGSMTRPPKMAPGPISVVVQSSGFGISVVVRCTLAGLGFRYVAASGNESDVTSAEFVRTYANDPETRAIFCYLEGLTDGRAFMAAAHHALEMKKPLVVLKAGNTEQGKRAAASHTANMTGSYDIYRAAFRQCGAIEVSDIDQAVDVLSCLSQERRPKGRRVALLGGSGGTNAVFSDAAEKAHLVLPKLHDETKAILKQNLPDLATIENPIDYTAGFPRSQDKARFRKTLEALMVDPCTDQLGLMLTTIERSRLELIGEVLAEVTSRSDKPVYAFTVMPENIVPEGRKFLHLAGIPVLSSPTRLAVAMALLARYYEDTAQTQRSFQPYVRSVLPAGKDRVLDESQSKTFLRNADIPVTRDVVLAPDDDTPPTAIQFPAALKVLSADIPHKTDVGGVKLGVTKASFVHEFSKLLSNVKHHAPDARIAGIIVSEMIGDGIEMIVGVVNDESFGPVVALGLGGIFAEVLNDITYRIAPYGESDAHQMINELKGRRMLDGMRGAPAADIDALAQVLVKVSEIAWNMREKLVSMDINPLFVRPRSNGVVAADALVVLREQVIT